ncbi:MAG: bifunctional transcriptional activator/DNA repair enzyme AdaA [Candidatus Levyibacteriota bacterium]
MFNDETYYKALLSHDSRFDGIFFIGVTSTHIYCRPICRVKVPQQKNCRFFLNAASAEQAGFRPCMRCRPELSPDSPIQNNHTAKTAARLIDKGFLQEKTLKDLAQEVLLSQRHLRRSFQEYWGVSPVAYAQTKKLLLAKQLLSETALSVTTIAFSAGFSSLSRFNELFKTRYKLSPRDLRKQVEKKITLKRCNFLSIIVYPLHGLSFYVS